MSSTLSTEPKKEHIEEIAYQKLIAEEDGCSIAKTILFCINANYTRCGEILPDDILAPVDVTDEVKLIEPTVAVKIKALYGILNSPEEPAPDFGCACKKNGKCLFYNYCHCQLPEGSVIELARGKMKAFDLMALGVELLKDIPADYPVTPIQEAQVASARSGSAVYDRSKIEEFIGLVQYPASSLDFETISTAYPAFDHTNPYELIPSQFSIHVEYEPGGTPCHHEYCADANVDPRPLLIEALLEMLPP